MGKRSFRLPRTPAAFTPSESRGPARFRDKRQSVPPRTAFCASMIPLARSCGHGNSALGRARPLLAAVHLQRMGLPWIQPVYVVGTLGIASTNIPGRRNGVFSLFSVVSKYDTNGNVLWTKQSPDGTTLAGESSSAVALGVRAPYLSQDLLTAPPPGRPTCVLLRHISPHWDSQE